MAMGMMDLNTAKQQVPTVTAAVRTAIIFLRIFVSSDQSSDHYQLLSNPKTLLFHYHYQLCDLIQ